MKKRILSALLAGSMALGLAACGSSSTGSTTAAAPAEGRNQIPHADGIRRAARIPELLHERAGHRIPLHAGQHAGG